MEETKQQWAVWKYVLPETGEFNLSMPEGAHILSVQTQQGCPVLWALVNPEEARKERYFRIVLTGHQLDSLALVYHGTFQLLGDTFVGHLFEYL